MTALVRYGRGVELRRQNADLARLVAEAAGGAEFRNEAGECEGEFDPMLLSEALKSITNRGRANGTETAATADGSEVVLRREGSGTEGLALVEWRGATGFGENGGDPFRGFAGGAGLRLALAAKIIRAHGGEVAHEAGAVRVRLPLRSS